jgi:hypothetical protein
MPLPARDITAIIGEGEWRNDTRGAMVNALNIFFKRGTRLTSITADVQDFVDGMILQGVNADGSRASASISMHDNRLYIVEADAPATGYPPPVAFTQNFSYVDKEGKTIRYRRMYSRRVSRPRRVPRSGARRPIAEVFGLWSLVPLLPRLDRFSHDRVRSLLGELDPDAVRVDHVGQPFAAVGNGTGAQ